MERIRLLKDGCTEWLGKLKGGIQEADPVDEDDSEDNDAAPNQLTKGIVLRQFIIALKIWGYFYLIVILYLLVCRLQTRWYYAAELSSTSIDASSQDDVQEVSSEVDWVAEQKEISRLLQQYEQVYNQREDHTNELTQFIDEVESVGVRLDGISTDFSTSPQELTESQLSLEKAGNLLNLESLSEMDSMDSLQLHFDEAMEEINRLVEMAPSASLEVLYKIFQQEWPTKKHSSTISSSKECPQPPPPITVPVSAARKSVIDQRVKKLESLLEKRNATFGITKFLQAESVVSVDRTTREGVTDLIAKLIEAAKNQQAPTVGKPDSVVDGCPSLETASALFEEGLLSLYEQGDLKNTIRSKALQLDPSLTSVVLNDNVPAPTKPQKRTAQSVNLRRLVDTPLLQQCIDWIDSVVEVVGGYNDGLDQWIDSYAGRQSVGFKAVNQLLEGAGKWDVPHPNRWTRSISSSKSD